MTTLYIRSRHLLQSLSDECGQDTIEYALLISIIAVAVVTNVGTLAAYVAGKFSALAGAL